ncbi:hypothetical protein [Sulfuriferula sp. AH1]|nr:hypothetical protein [Sulfuriferula sp. AH1]
MAFGQESGRGSERFGLDAGVKTAAAVAEACAMPVYPDDSTLQ